MKLECNVRLLVKLGFILIIGVGMSACSKTTWKEEVLLHDGGKIVVERSITRGGHGIAHQELATEETLSFSFPGSNQNVVWKDKFSEEIGSSSFNLLMLEIQGSTAYIVASPMGCLSYNKVGRPNPPYVVFKYQGKEWSGIPLRELPIELKLPNLIVSSPDFEVKKSGVDFISVEMIKQMNAGNALPEYETIIRNSLPIERIRGMCEELMFYKGVWIMPNDPVARSMLDRTSK